jgi:hypothetical protein
VNVYPSPQFGPAVPLPDMVNMPEVMQIPLHPVRVQTKLSEEQVMVKPELCKRVPNHHPPAAKLESVFNSLIVAVSLGSHGPDNLPPGFQNVINAMPELATSQA